MGKLRCVAGLVMAALAGSAPAAASDDQQLIALSRQWMQAVQDKDRAALQRIMAEDYRLRAIGDGSTRAVGRDAWIGNALNRDWSNFRYTNFDVEVMGERAVVASSLRFSVSPIPFALESGVLDEWVLRDGRWQVRSRWLGDNVTLTRLVGIAAFTAGVLLTLLLIWLRRRFRTRKGR